MVAVKSGKCEILVISVYEKHSTKKHGMKLFKDHDNGEELFLHDTVIVLDFSQFKRLICTRLFLLDDYSTCLVAGSISINVKRYIVVGMYHKDI